MFINAATAQGMAGKFTALEEEINGYIEEAARAGAYEVYINVINEGWGTDKKVTKAYTYLGDKIWAALDHLLPALKAAGYEAYMYGQSALYISWQDKKEDACTKK